MTDNVENVQVVQPQTETVADTEHDTAQDSTQTEESKPKQEHANGYEKRISRLVAARHAEARQVQELKAELAKYKQPAKEVDPEPKDADFDSIEEYAEAKGAWKERQKFLQEKKAEAEKSELAKRQDMGKQKEEAHKQLEASFKKTNPDYDGRYEIFNEALDYIDKDTVQFKAFADAVFSADNTPAIVYELGKDPDAIENLLKKTPYQIYREITRIEAAYEAKNERSESDEEEKKPKQVASPPSPVKGSGKSEKKLKDLPWNEMKAKFRKMGVNV